MSPALVIAGVESPVSVALPLAIPLLAAMAVAAPVLLWTACALRHDRDRVTPPGARRPDPPSLD